MSAQTREEALVQLTDPDDLAYVEQHGLIWVDLAPDDKLCGPCFDCLRWRYQLLGEEAGLFVREWHSPDCREALRLNAEDS